MTIIAELAILLSLCMVGEVISSQLPFVLPASVVSLILLIILLLTGVIKEGYIKRTADFFMTYMSFFFVPSCIGIMQYFDLLAPMLLPFIVITILTTPVIYGITAWSVQLMVRMGEKKEGEHD